MMEFYKGNLCYKKAMFKTDCVLQHRDIVLIKCRFRE